MHVDVCQSPWIVIVDMRWWDIASFPLFYVMHVAMIVTSEVAMIFSSSLSCVVVPPSCSFDFSVKHHLIRENLHSHKNRKSKQTRN